MATDLFLSEDIKKRTTINTTKDIDPRVRERAVFDLGRCVGDDVIVAVANALHDEDIDVCRQAAVSLFTFGAKARTVIPTIITALQHADPIIRRAAAATLSMIGPEARAALPDLRKLEQDPDELLRVWVHAAVQAIGEVRESALGGVGEKPNGVDHQVK